MSKEKYLSEKIAAIAWRIPGLDFSKKYDFQQWVTKRENQKLNNLEKKVLQKLQSIHSDKYPKEVSGFRGPIIGFREKLKDGNGKEYRYSVATDAQRLEVEITDLPPADSLPIRKYRVFLCRFEINGETSNYDLSCLGDKPFSWRRNALDNDYPEKSLTLKQSCRFMKEILTAKPESSVAIFPQNTYPKF
jgi:hypothetical protein